MYGQLLNIDTIQNGRISRWNRYFERLQTLSSRGLIELPDIPAYANNNAHVFYLVCKSADERNRLIDHLKLKGIGAVFHYLSLHKSSFFESKHDGRELPHADRFSDCLVRIPLHLHLSDSEIDHICAEIIDFYRMS